MGKYHVKEVLCFEECEMFLRDFLKKNPFSIWSVADYEKIKNDLQRSLEKRENHILFGILKNQELLGLFSFLILKDEGYLEMLSGFSYDKEAYDEMIMHLKENYHGFNVDIVFNPDNFMLYDCLKQKDVKFDIEQQKMNYDHSELDVDTTDVLLLEDSYIPSYLSMHNTDMYWTGEKVIEAKERFRTYVITEKNIVVGYLDVTTCFEENEPFDLLVQEKYRRKGYGRKLLAKALEMNKPHGMSLHVNVDNQPAICLYESMGFVKAEKQNSIVAHLQL